MTRRYSSGLIFSNGENTEVNATFTQTSIGPSSSSTRSRGGEDLLGVGDVHRHDQRPAAAGLHVPRGGGQSRLAAGQQGHRRAALGERPRRPPGRYRRWPRSPRPLVHSSSLPQNVRGDLLTEMASEPKFPGNGAVKPLSRPVWETVAVAPVNHRPAGNRTKESTARGNRGRSALRRDRGDRDGGRRDG